MTKKIFTKNLYFGITLVVLAGILSVSGIGNAFSQNNTDAPSTVPSLDNSTTSGYSNATDGGSTGNWSNSNATVTVQ